MKNLIILCLVPTLSFAVGVDYPFENICDYDSNVVTTYKGEIEKYKVPSKKVFPYYKDTKQCLVTVQAKVKDKWYSETANHVFTADMAENDACNHAINRAKENILTTQIPEMIEGKKQLNCSLTMQRNSCTIKYMNVVMPGLGLQEVKLKQCK